MSVVDVDDVLVEVMLVGWLLIYIAAALRGWLCDEDAFVLCYWKMHMILLGWIIAAYSDDGDDDSQSESMIGGADNGASS